MFEGVLEVFLSICNEKRAGGCAGGVAPEEPVTIGSTKAVVAEAMAGLDYPERAFGFLLVACNLAPAMGRINGI